MANFKTYVPLFLVLISCFTCSSYAYQFIVGGNYGWGLNPSENYNSWAERMRFQVNDTLLFKYKQGQDSVLVVNKDDYDNCIAENYIRLLNDGKSKFKFDRSGPFYFISGNKTNCIKGQKLIIVVLAVRNRPTAAPPKGSSPSPSSPSPAPAKAHGPSVTLGSPASAPGSGISTAGNTPVGVSPVGVTPLGSHAPSVVVLSIIVSVVLSMVLGGVIISI
ncbi:hypothetical protein RD792_007298 [Penstemon davidsonii]|uniref:Phytocyanin domain-containing protein n=1 Tax=Penstemon davidsonii TaxID=160366 RepID=A0ABR0D7C7_9LAMI|nr:hypothetical protein RD792_007298 [Penstemon davidsonii]